MKYNIQVLIEDLSRKFKIPTNVTRITSTLQEDNKHFWSYLARLLRIKNILYSFVEKIKAHVLSSVTFFRNSCLLWYDMEKYGGAGHATDNNTANALCMLDT